MTEALLLARTALLADLRPMPLLDPRVDLAIVIGAAVFGGGILAAWLLRKRRSR